MAYVRSTRRDRIVAAGGAGAGVALLALGLIQGLVGRFAPPDVRALQIITIAMPPPPPEERVVPAPQKNSRPEGEAAPPNLKAKPTEIVAPLPPLPVPPPLTAAPVAGPGSEARSGAAEVPGPGTGAGGEGQGRGSGGAGEGDGGGGDGTPPVRIAGRLKDSDYPRGALEAGVGGTVEVRYLVDEKGRVEDCEVARSSGNAEIDQTTCRLIRQRFRFKPSRDAEGNPVPAYILEFHSWIMRIMPPEERPRRR